MAKAKGVNRLLSQYLIGIVLFQALVGTAHTAEAEEEPEKKISKRDTYQSAPSYSAPEYSAPATYSAPNYSAPPAYPSYPAPQYAPPTYAYPQPTYAAPVVYETMPQPYYYPQSYGCSYSYQEPSTQPAECSSSDLPLSGTSTAKNCTCTYTSSPPGCTLRMCTSADVTNTACTAFKCICNGPTASPSYCVQVLDYPEDAKLNFTPTKAGTTTPGLQQASMNSLMTQAILKEAQRERIMEALGTQSQLASQEKLMEALGAVKQNQMLQAATANNNILALAPASSSSVVELVSANSLSNPQQLLAVVQNPSSNLEAIEIAESQPQDAGLLGGLLNLGR